MTHAQSEVAASEFNEALHHRAPAGSGTGGQFSSGGGGGGAEHTSKSRAPARKAAPAATAPRRHRTGPAHVVIPPGQLGYDPASNHGTGYGHKGGDRRVRALQEALNRLGLTDMHGKKLAVDGKLGPLTTSAIKAAQLRLGMRPTGVIAPAFVDRLKATRVMPAPRTSTSDKQRHAPAKKAPAKSAPKKDAPRRARGQMRDTPPTRPKPGGTRQSVYAKYDPSQLRDHHGRWADQPGSAIVDTIRDWSELRLDDDNNDQVVMSSVVDTHNGRRLLLGFEGHRPLHSDDADAEAEVDTTPDVGSVVALDHTAARRLDAALAEVAERGAARRKQLRALYDEQDRLGEHVQELLKPGEKDPFWQPSEQAVSKRADAEDRLAELDDEIAALKPDEEFASGDIETDGALLHFGGWNIDGDDPDYYMYVDLPDGTLYFDDGDMARTRKVLQDAFPSVAPVTAASDPKAPYGPASEVDYADPGFRQDGKKRYPLNSEKRCRNAWARINQPDNAAKYSPEDLAKVKAKIKAALKRYGVETADDEGGKKKVAAAELRDIELARPGTWKLSSGSVTWTEKHLHDAARYASRPGARPWPVKIGHADPRFDGEPALGWVGNVRVEDRDHGPALIGDITGMPDWLAAAAPDAWPYRSIEGWQDFTDPETGERYALVGEALALLGVTPPGVSTIQSLRDLPRAVGIAAASGTRVVASMASAPVAAEEGAGPMDPAMTRTALGLPADAPDDEVRSALLVAAQNLGGDPEPASAPVQASLFEEPPAPKAPAVKAPMAAPGTVIIASSVLQEMRETINRLNAFVEKTKRGERDMVIAAAAKAGKFTPAQRQHFTKLWDSDPEGTRELLDSLLPNSAFPVAASGYSGGVPEADDDLDREIAALSRPREVSRG